MKAISEDRMAVGFFKTKATADYAWEALQIGGFESSNISVTLPHSSSFSDELGGRGSHISEDLMIGAGTGAMVGGILGFFIGLGAMAIPGVGPFVAGGPIMATLAGAAFGSAFGSVAGALIGVGFPGYDPNGYSSPNVNGALITIRVRSSEEFVKVKKCLEHSGADAVILKSDSKNEWKALKQKYSKKIKNSEVKAY